MATYWKRVVSCYHETGGRGLLSALGRKLLRRSRRLREFKTISPFFKNKYGLEIGGPSAVFNATGLLPLYSIAHRLDGCNFSTSTIWEGTILEGMHYTVAKTTGYQYIAEATDLSLIPSGKYDFLLSSHSLEHIANPLGALQEWLRVLKSDGVLLLLLPDKNATFDHRRGITPFTHLLDDAEKKTGEDDLTHLEEILSLHDLDLDPPAGSKEAFAARSRANFKNRCLHHHVFDLALMRDIFNYFGLRMIVSTTGKPFHLIGFGQKCGDPMAAQ